MLQRQIEPLLKKWFFRNKALILTGARQVGKSTMINRVTETTNVKTLLLNADEAQVRKALKDPSLQSLKNIIGKNKLIIIDEVQRIENSGLLLKLIVDNFKGIQLVATGSSALDISDKVFEPLTGRHFLFHLYPFTLSEMYRDLSPFQVQKELAFHLVYGSYPEVYNNKLDAEMIIKNLGNQYLYKDVLAWKDIRKPDVLDKLLQLLAYQAGNEVSLNELGSQLNIKTETVDSYINVLEKSFVVFRLKAFSTNERKEVTKMKKVFFWDNGIRNSLIGDFRPIEQRQDAGALWENMMISERMKQNQYLQKKVKPYFWRSLQQQEVDYIETENKIIRAYEMKYNQHKKNYVTKAFTNMYPKSKTALVQPTNFAEFCHLE